MKRLWFTTLLVVGCGSEMTAPDAGSQDVDVAMCGAPVILSPGAGETVAALHLETSAPACIGTTKCYLDGNPTPVASGTGNLVADVAVGAGPHGISCNGWDASGRVYASGTTAFVAD